MISLNITSAHIAAGELAHGRRCPMALAARDAGLTDVMVLPNRIFWDDRGHRRAARLPPEAVAWQRRYDFGFPMNPIAIAIAPEGGAESRPEDEDAAPRLTATSRFTALTDRA